MRPSMCVHLALVWSAAGWKLPGATPAPRWARSGAVVLRASQVNAVEEAVVVVAAADGKGMGVFAVEPVEIGAWVCNYVGVLATDDECDVRYAGMRGKSGGGDYLFRLDKERCVDAQNSNHFSRFFNHAEDGNIEAKVIAKEDRIEFRACRRIDAGEELVFDCPWAGARRASRHDSACSYSYNLPVRAQMA